MTAISIKNVGKRFGPTVALEDVSIDIESGETHAILGENGAGKSTLVKILSGLIHPDSGTVSIAGREIRHASPLHASRAGVETAFQEIPLVPDLTVAENFVMPDDPRVFGVFRSGREAIRRTEGAMSAHKVRNIDPRIQVADLDLSQRQVIEILRAIARQPKILLLDEPTAALSVGDVAWLEDRIAELKAAGTTIVIVTHRMPEVRRLCDRLSVLRNGKGQGTFPVNDLSDAQIVELMVGDARAHDRADTEPRAITGPVVMRASQLSSGRISDVSFELSAGEIVGVAALQGMGQLELFKALFGIDRPRAGELEIFGSKAPLRSPRDAIRRGIGLVPEDRKSEGLAVEMSGAANASLPILGRAFGSPLVSRAAERKGVDAVFDKVNLVPSALYRPVKTFSGGNQQKIVLAKWLLADSRILLLFDPTRGVDIGTKEEIYDLIRDQAAQGVGVLFHSTELAELPLVCDRVLALYRGRVAGVLSGSDLTEAAIGRLILGGQTSEAIS